jgi:aerobic-type carbon monoxide dehydrogenase small subunit (CoxS/CutS family)
MPQPRDDSGPATSLKYPNVNGGGIRDPPSADAYGLRARIAVGWLAMKRELKFRLNGSERSLDTEDGRMLLWVLRTFYALTVTKYGCGAGHCAACSVLVDGALVRACVTPVAVVDGKDVTTIEGLAAGDALHPLQQAFIDHGAFQCGYCTSGMLLGAVTLLRANPHPSRADIVQALERHYCRCGAHQRIIAAIESVAGGEGAAQ